MPERVTLHLSIPLDLLRPLKCERSSATQLRTSAGKRDLWPFSSNATATYLDTGEVTITGGSEALVIPRATVDLRDPFFRAHKAASGTSAPRTSRTPMKTAPSTSLPGALHSVKFAGLADMPAKTYDDVLYVPELHEVTNPTAPAGYEVLALVAVTGSKGPVVTCVEPDDGSITVPRAMLDIVQRDYQGLAPLTLVRQTLTHAVRELEDKNGPTGRRIDILGVVGYETSFAFP